MQRRIRRTAWTAVLTVAGAAVLGACGGSGPAPAVTTTVTAPAPTVTVTAAPTRAAPAPVPSGSKPAPSTDAQAARKPEVVLTGDAGAAGKELQRLRKTGWWNPDKIEYADDPVTALQQFDKWLSKGYVAPGGAWTPAGEAAVEAANDGGPEL
ncbi:hypothetical protein ACIQM4_23550 [Streptomyces sp. NPDC091272]|uniref:hypothetical protein n=1 Tax=Streptomyces sp. NPDC091272 TaxID=3365981 RepID=UPI003811D548